MNEPVLQERDRIASKRVGQVCVAAALALGAGVAVSTWILHAQGRAPGQGLPASVPQEVGIVEQTPIMEAHRASDLRRDQRAELARYGWVDDAHQIATIPIDRAMRIVAERRR